jgi:hypothetical protein
MLAPTPAGAKKLPLAGRRPLARKRNETESYATGAAPDRTFESSETDGAFTTTTVSPVCTT